MDWTAKQIKTKYDTERKRFQQWKLLIDGYPRGGFLPDGRPDVSDDTWERFLRQNNTPSRKLNWLMTTPLGDVDVYRSVFSRELAVGTYIAEAQDINDAQFGSDEDSGPENNSDEDDDVVVPAPRRRLTARQVQRQQTDPDITPLQGSPSAVVIPQEHSTRGTSKKRKGIVIGESLRAIAKALVEINPSEDNLAVAVTDL